MAGAVHGLELVVGFFDFHRAKHAVFVKAGVSAGFPEVQSHDMWGVDEVVAALEKFLAEPILHNFADETAFGMPEDEARAGFFLNTEKFEFDAELPVIAPLGFLEAVEIFVELFWEKKHAA